MLSYEILVEGEFAAAHQLRLYDGRLEPLHGHNWKVEVCLAGPKLDSIGVLADFTEVRRRLNDTLQGLHDRFLNDLPAFRERNPSAEMVALHIHQAMSADLPPGVRVSRVRVWEAPGCAATVVLES